MWCGKVRGLGSHLAEHFGQALVSGDPPVPLIETVSGVEEPPQSDGDRYLLLADCQYRWTRVAIEVIVRRLRMFGRGTILVGLMLSACMSDSSF